MDPILNLLLPFIPLAMMTAAVVAFVRKLFTKDGKTVIDGRLAVFSLAAFVSFLVVVWAQLRAAGGVDWTKLLIDWPVVFGLAAGGTTWLQKLRRDGVLSSVEIGAEIDAQEAPARRATNSIFYDFASRHRDEVFKAYGIWPEDMDDAGIALWIAKSGRMNEFQDRYKTSKDAVEVVP